MGPFSDIAQPKARLPACWTAVPLPFSRHRENHMSDQTADWARHEREARRVRRDFWAKAKRVAARLPFAEDLLAAYYCAFDRNTPRHVQLALIGALAYFVLPFDFVPDMLPLLGFTDDAAVLATALRLVAGHIGPHHREAAQRALARNLAAE
jgi:uncharacterized membrane protein YkvA (DUF1232 family)